MIVINYGLECVTILGLQCVGVFNLGVYTFIGVLHTIWTFKSVGSRSMEGSSTYGRLGLEGLLLFVYSNLFSSGSIYHLEGGGEVFYRVLRFPL